MSDKTNHGFPRTKESVGKMVSDLNTLGLLHTVSPLHQTFDCLQTEYILQAIWSRVTKKNGDDDGGLLLPECLASHRLSSTLDLPQITTYLFSQLRQQRPRSTKKENRWINCHLPSIERNLPKHHIDKPKVKGRGNTTAILTDVHGFRSVLEYALIFHATVHEFHELPRNLQTNFDHLTNKLTWLLKSIFSRIYRGDNGVDVLTCKCRAHFHLAGDIQYFGTPMGYDASKGERNLKFWAKQISKTAQKCGEVTFIQQTTRRISDHSLLAKVIYEQGETHKSLRNRKNVPVTPNSTKWWYTRKTPHMCYNLTSQEALLLNCVAYKNLGSDALLTKQVKQALHSTHGSDGVITIWKEIRVNLGVETNAGYHHVRSFHEFDKHGPFFDWAHINHGRNLYRPAKVVLLYQFQGKDFALVWQAKPPTDTELSCETNLSARWRMNLLPSGLPCIESVATDSIERCVMVSEHWRCQNQNHLPSTEIARPGDLSMFSIDETYERFSWMLNFIDDGRWNGTDDDHDSDGLSGSDNESDK